MEFPTAGTFTGSLAKPTGEDPEAAVALRACTYAGRPFGDENFVTEMGIGFGRHWARGRPRKEAAGEEGDAREKSSSESTTQLTLF